VEGFAPENDLERLMLEAHAGGVEMPAFLRALLSSPVFLAPQEGSAAEELALTAHRGRDGNAYIPVFTSPARLRRFSGQEQAASVPLGALAESWPEDVSLVVNPGDPVELALPGHDFRRLAAGAEPGGEEAVPAGTTVLVGDPAVEPQEVLDAAAAVCERHPELAAAYRAQIHLQRPGEEPHLALGLLLDDLATDAESLQRDVADAATGAGAEAVSILMLEPAVSGNAVADYMLQRTRPFYERD
jgi:hypothetical protein